MPLRPPMNEKTGLATLSFAQRLRKTWPSSSRSPILVRESRPIRSNTCLTHSSRPRVNGMGMGLSLARTIIEAHHGRLWAENGATGGAIFRFRLPLSSMAEGSMNMSLFVHVVDDDELFRKSVGRLLRACGFRRQGIRVSPGFSQPSSLSRDASCSTFGCRAWAVSNCKSVLRKRRQRCRLCS